MCVDCEARRQLARDALYRAKVGEFLGHVATGAAEIVGLHPKTGSKELAKNRQKEKPKPDTEAPATETD